MSSRPCAGLAELRSAYVDEALADGDRERLLAHLVHCAACRDDVEELREIRRLVGGSRTGTAAPAELSHRLVSIAGAQAADPLWSRPFQRSSTGVLPSARRARRLRRGALGLAFGALAATAAGVGYAAAPSVALAAVDDPSGEAQAGFTATLTQSTLTSDSIGAVMLASPDRLTPVQSQQRAPAERAGQPTSSLTGTQAEDLLIRASSAASELSYSGVQSFRATLNGRTITAVVQIDARKGQGSQLNVFNERGEKVLTGFAAPPATSRMVDHQMLALLERNYVVSGWTGSQVANRPATVVEASTGGALAARWWIDDATGLLLRQEVYDRTGQVRWTSGFTTLRIGSSESILEHLPPRLAASTITTALTVSSAEELSARGWSCPASLAGLALVRVRSDRTDDPTALHLVYSDGLSTVSVFQQRGRLDGPPQGSQWDSGLGAYLRQDTSGLATWQSGETVYTVVTDGSAQRLADAVRGLPHEPLRSPTTIDRIRAGWTEILTRGRR